MLARNIRVEEDLMDQLFIERKRACPRPAAAGAVREGGSPVADPEDVSGNACGNRRYDQVACQFLHEPGPRTLHD
jgi:hypothetical protein